MKLDETSPASLRQTIEGAQKLGLCPNRIWQSGARLADWRTALSEYLPDFCRTLPDGSIGHEDHLRCTLDSCEFSSRNFTAVIQYHEPYPYEIGSQIAVNEHHADPSVCFPVRGLFDDRTLVKAVKAGTCTAWKYAGLAMLDHPRPYMAISHVWSDGTGLGPWPSKQVPSCLYQYFSGMAGMFGCEGLWWDTLCVPQDREARGEALRSMDQNYAHARLTLVHDRFLRALPFQGPDKACFAIIMSTWFTRGWTALELARSRRVKVVFADAVYDLDHEILGRAAAQNAAAKIIQHLRDAFDGRHAITLDELLSTLAPRFTSWPKDRAVIAGLLASIPLNPNQDRELWQRDIYQDILRSIGKVSHGHLFHRSATMSDGFAWCPMDLFELPKSSASPALSMERNGALHGAWEVAALDDESVRGEVSEKAVWEIRHPLLEDTIRQVILNDCKDHVLLLDPEQVTTKDPRGGSNVRNAVIAKVIEGTGEEPDLLQCQYVGSLDFHSAIQVKTRVVKNVKIGGTEGCAELTLSTDEGGTTDKTAHFQDLETQQGPSESQILPATDGSQQNFDKMLRLHVAGERQETKTVESILSLSDDPAKELTRRDDIGQTPLHRAAWGGCVDTVRVMLSHGSIIHAKDNGGRTALHLAAEQGFERIVSCLYREAATLGVDLVNATTAGGLTALHFATLNGHYDVVKFILSVAGAAIDAVDDLFKWAALHIAADIGRVPIFQLLIDAGAKVEQTDVVGWTALHLAAMSGHVSITKHLLQRNHTELISREDSQGWLPIHFAAINGHKRVVDELYQLSDGCWDLAMPLALLSLSTGKETLDPSDLKRVIRWQRTAEVMRPAHSHNNTRHMWTRMHLAAIDGRPCVTKRLLSRLFPRHTPRPDEALPPLLATHWAIHDSYFGTIGLLAQLGADLIAPKVLREPPLWLGRDMMTLCILLENGASGQTMNREGFTLLTHAIHFGWEGRVGQLLSTGKVDPDAPDERHFLTPLALAADLGHEGIVRRLLATGRVNLVPTAEEHLGRRAPLYYAVRSGHTTIARLIVEAGGGPGAKTKPEPDYPSPLMMAIESANVEMVRILLDQGAQMSQFELGEQNAISYASECGHEEIVKVLLGLEHPGIHSRNDTFLGWTCLFYAVKSGHENVVQLLLEAASPYDMRIKDTHERTPLFYAAMYGFERIMRLLLRAGDNNVTKKDYFGHQPRWYAANSGYPAVVELLDSVCQDTDNLEDCGNIFSREGSSGGNVTGAMENQEEGLLGPSSYLTTHYIPFRHKDWNPSRKPIRAVLFVLAFFALFFILFWSIYLR